MASYEYGIAHFTDLQDPPAQMHRQGMSEDVAREWIEMFLEDGGRPGAFCVIRRPVGEWEKAQS